MADIYVRSTDGNDADNGSTWALAKATLAGAASVAAAGDTIYVSQAHSETPATATITVAGTLANPIRILCVNDSATPPTTLAASSLIAPAANANIALSGSFYMHGIELRVSGTGSILCNNTDAHSQIYNACQFTLNTTSAGRFIRTMIANAAHIALFEARNCTFTFGRADSQNISALGAARFYGCFFVNASSVNTDFYVFSASGSGEGAIVDVAGCDFSQINGTLWDVLLPLSVTNTSAAGSFLMRNCNFPASWAGQLCQSAVNAPGWKAELVNSDSTGTNYRLWIESRAGAVKHDTAVYLTGERDADTPISHKFDSSDNCNFTTERLYGPELHVWNDTTGSSVTATVEIILDSATALNDDDMWLEVMYPGSSTSPLGTWVSDAKSNILASGTAQTSSSEAWTGTGGFANPQKRKLSVTFTPQMKGPIVGRVVMGKASTTVYVDPDLRLT